MSNQNKVLLLGKANAGKTSMRSIIFANYLARDTFRLGPTIGVEHSSLRFLGNLTLNLWDCGGQKRFLANYFQSQRDQIFRGVKILIYVFDVESMSKEGNSSSDLDEFQRSVDSVQQFNPEASVFVLIHKMDLIQEDDSQQIFSDIKANVSRLIPSTMKSEFFGTSIWNETLFKAWSSIVRSLIPNLVPIENALKRLCAICDSDEIVVFEKHTFLVVSQVTLREQRDPHRLEKMSNVVKAFKLRCGYYRGQTVNKIKVQNSLFKCLIMDFTKTTSVMVINSQNSTQSAAITSNFEASAKHFEALFAAI